ncbi:alpha/beta fold hydrolase [Streptosporangium lutulentum]|uniref:Pimeloyl-ACP methyl ester carboxylesterase n=1 Tax=Streptosporangium lutulentum TaxID=1461250 RepID=A0ABT9QRG2_9ACTN|nr:alpha/beta hydrolase [Streptosporangium lutulentum]MDP9849337.1 pimeloyl-ACP methyl ester carboxylesterase [Streptosporangium lutulentum]
MRIDVNGIALEVQVSGEGPAVLLVHGYPDTHACWRHQVAALNAAGYRTIAPDLRGFGASDKPDGLEGYELAAYAGDLIGILDRLDVDRAHLVGHDWGSALAQRVAITTPGRVTGLACLSVGHAAAMLSAGWEQREKSWYMMLFQFPGVAERWLSEHDFANMREMLAEHPGRDEVIERMRDPRALSAALAIYRRGVPPEWLLADPADLPPIPVPTMGVWSSGDRFLTEQSMAGTGKHVASTWRYERLDGAGHWMQLEAPGEVNDLLLDFLASAGAQAG